MDNFFKKLLIVIGIAILSSAICNVLFNVVKSFGGQDSRINVLETGSGYCIFYDKNTGIQYLRYINGGITPLYNADGSLYLYEEVENHD